ncbi:hypothetical protein N7539_006846 [Penicillium diatomitis]|uniref:Uncharacterized protein n=1 Tax=Penicillium diatomitis TaxID=2819901 RepID=A0A9X0BSN5_9EURO|nr:uncharacterized protein N7539_006846 [Penicillium diatomitis]KAJ5480952.1 hypothetical protein N7539_006846 [Penicillium diatomitis]
MGSLRGADDVETIGEQFESRLFRKHYLIKGLLWAVLLYGSLVLSIIAYCNPALLPFNPLSYVFNIEVSPFFAFSQGSEYFPKPHGVRIVALVPFHYHERTAILDCYLQNNLVQNRGLLDQVVFIPQTDDAFSLQWLDALVQKTPEYAISVGEDDMDWKFTQANVLYVRIDGDVVFLEDHTIPTIVKTRLEDPDSLMISANVMSEGALSSLHSHHGVALPYLPELDEADQDPQTNGQSHSDWHASNLPLWNGPAAFVIEKEFRPPFQGHRWLPVAEEGLDRDPIASAMRRETGPSLQEWTVSAQHHYSFLDHLESNTLSRYKFPLWKNPPEAVSSTLGCFWGKDAAALRELYGQQTASEGLSTIWTASDGSHPNITIDGKGLASHYSAEMAVAGLDSTDLLERYHAYAQENVCRPTR